MRFKKDSIRLLSASRIGVKATTPEGVQALYSLNQDLVGYPRKVPFEKNVTYWKTKHQDFMRRNCNLKVPVIPIEDMWEESTDPLYYVLKKQFSVLIVSTIVSATGVFRYKNSSMCFPTSFLKDEEWFTAIYAKKVPLFRGVEGIDDGDCLKYNDIVILKTNIIDLKNKYGKSGIKGVVIVQKNNQILYLTAKEIDTIANYVSK